MRAVLIHNPVAGQRNISEDLDQVSEFLRSQGWEVTLRRTLGSGDATTFAREAVVQGYHMAVAVGGDGTLGEVATGLAHSECALGVLPIGTGNVWAHMLGIPTWTLKDRGALLAAARVLVEGHVQRIDLGRVRDRRFLLWAGVGFDAQVAQGVEPHREMRRSLGNLPYVVGAFAVALGLRGTRTTVVIDGKASRQRIILLLVSNAQLYGGLMRVAPQARLDDGLLDISIFKGGNWLDAMRYAIKMLLGVHLQDPSIETYRGRQIEIRGNRPLPLHFDGDPAGYAPVSIVVEPQALSVVVPATAPPSLFQYPGFRLAPADDRREAAPQP